MREEWLLWWFARAHAATCEELHCEARRQSCNNTKVTTTLFADRQTRRSAGNSQRFGTRANQQRSRNSPRPATAAQPEQRVNSCRSGQQVQWWVNHPHWWAEAGQQPKTAGAPEGRAATDKSKQPAVSRQLGKQNPVKQQQSSQAAAVQPRQR